MKTMHPKGGPSEKLEVSRRPDGDAHEKLEVSRRPDGSRSDANGDEASKRMPETTARGLERPLRQPQMPMEPQHPTGCPTTSLKRSEAGHPQGRRWARKPMKNEAALKRCHNRRLMNERSLARRPRASRPQSRGAGRGSPAKNGVARVKKDHDPRQMNERSLAMRPKTSRLQSRGIGRGSPKERSQRQQRPRSPPNDRAMSGNNAEDFETSILRPGARRPQRKQSRATKFTLSTG